MTSQQLFPMYTHGRYKDIKMSLQPHSSEVDLSELRD